MKRLQLMGQKMYEIYFSSVSADCIDFDDDSRDQMKRIVFSQAAEDIVLLRTSPTLFKAYDHVMDIMEQKLLCRFYRSPEVIKIERCLSFQEHFFPIRSDSFLVL